MTTLKYSTIDTLRQIAALSMCVLSLLLLMFSTSAQANSCQTLDNAPENIRKDNVVFAGLAMAGDPGAINSIYPYTLSLQQEINQALFDRLSTLNPEHLMLRCQMNLQSGNSLAMALAVDYETVNQRQTGNLYQVILEVSAQLLVYDVAPNEKAILASYPLSLGAYIDTFSSPPSQSTLKNLVRAYFLGGLDKMPSNLVQRTADVISDLQVRKSYDSKIGIGNVYVGEQPTPHLPGHFRGSQANQENFKNYIARQFANQLSKNQQVPVIPRKVDNALSQIAYYFTGDNSSQQFTVPTADYYVDISVDGAVVQKTDENNTAIGYSYITFLSTQLRSQVGGDDKVLFKYQLRNAASGLRLKSQSQDKHWEAIEQTLLVLIADFTGNINKPDRDWVRLQDMDQSSRKALGVFAETLEKCR